jgi:GNAT superfamily N-acetyltransferase
MQLTPAKKPTDFLAAANLLTDVVNALYKQGEPLWTGEQVAIHKLKETYRLDELFFLTEKTQTVGVVFLQETDALFWPERSHLRDTLYIHKLALHPEYRGKGKGHDALAAIQKYAIHHGFHSLRLDCDGAREKLHRFYQRFGFQFVDRFDLQGFDVARYMLEVKR